MQKKEEEKIVLALTSFQCFLHISKVQFRFIEVVLYLVVQRTDEGQCGPIVSGVVQNQPELNQRQEKAHFSPLLHLHRWFYNYTFSLALIHIELSSQTTKIQHKCH